ncbi:MAG: hypothetical protein H6R00_4045 [Proteobacteria bacterium]|nr:hypothetical protein [Pseudomonadota bacterium]
MRFLVAAVLLGAQINAVNAESLTYDIKSGEAVSEHLYLLTDGTCVSSGQYRTKVLKDPEHGKFIIRPDVIVAVDPPCKGHRFTGTTFSYTSQKGFRGSDHLSVSVGYPVDTSEMLYSYTTYDVTVNVH